MASKNIFFHAKSPIKFQFSKIVFSLPRPKKAFYKVPQKTQKKNKPKYRILKTDFFEKEKSASPPQAMLGNTFAARERKKKAIDGKTTKSAIKSPRKMPRAPYKKIAPPR